MILAFIDIKDPFQVLVIFGGFVILYLLYALSSLKTELEEQKEINIELMTILFDAIYSLSDETIKDRSEKKEELLNRVREIQIKQAKAISTAKAEDMILGKFKKDNSKI